MSDEETCKHEITYHIPIGLGYREECAYCHEVIIKKDTSDE